MPLDHYVSQVHLKKFYSPVLDELMFAIRKSDLEQFRCNAKSVCRIEDNSSNAYLRKDRLIEEFLRYVEPRYNEAVSNLESGTVDQQSILAIAGFVAYVMGCSPAGTRILSDPLRASLETTSAILERRGDLERAPAILGNKTLTELLADGTVHFKIDQKFPQAMATTSIIGWVSVFGNSLWEILCNDEPGSPFFTSDFPIGLELSEDPRVINRIVPLTPNLAIRIRPDIRLSGAKPDLTFQSFRSRKIQLDRQQIAIINRCLVRCAEDTVFYRDDAAWVAPFVAKNSRYRVEGITQQLPHGRGFLNVSTQRIVAV
jgi:hypothetical protein